MQNILRILSFLLLIVGLTSCNGSEDLPEDLQFDAEEVRELVEESTDVQRKVRGSCNSIAEKSACVDYIGSFWSKDQMQLNCGSAGVWSQNTCPYSEIGGCQTGAGAIFENVIWNYGHGGLPFPTEAIGSAAKACNATGMAKWVSPEGVN